MITLYKVSSTGAIQEWSVEGKLSTATILVTYGQHGGAMQMQTETVHINKSGRTLKEQMLLQIRSRISKQKAKGYRTSIEEARKFAHKNELDLHKPMLAQRYDKVKGFNYDLVHRQYKYDGHRMLVAHTDDGLIAYTRNGKLIDTLDHILDGISIPHGAVLDGEVYCHGEPLQTISSWCKRFQENTLKLKYIVYDTIHDAPYSDRLQMLSDWSLGPACEVAQTWVTTDSVTEDLREAIEYGYEGLILRCPRSGYEAGKRSKSLIKVKQLIDDEATVTGIEESKDGWAVLICKTDDGIEFRTSAPGTMEEKTHVLQHPNDYIGKQVTYEYFSLTSDGKPFHAAARRWREDL